MSGGLGLPARLRSGAKHVWPQIVAGDASDLLNRQHVFRRHPLPLAYCLRGHTAHPADMGGTTKRFEGNVLHG